MRKSVAVMTATLAIAGSSIAYAQQRFGGPGDENDGGRRFEQNYRPSIDDIKAFTEARIAALKAGLQLSPEQEKNWAPFEQALRDLAKLHLQRVQGNREQQPTDPFARLQLRAETMSQFGAALKHIADTGEPLYQSLTDAQKHRFTILARILRPHWIGGGFWQQHRGHAMMGPERDRDNSGHDMMGPEKDEDSDGL